MKLNHLLTTTFAGLLACALWSCDTVAEEDRLIYVKKPEVKRSVLIEDFTGQNCVNCPAATEVIEQLQEEFGDSVIIAVGIHSGPFGHRSGMNSARLPLCTETGDEYYTHWGIVAQPGIMINRSTPIYNTAEYRTVVRDALGDTTPLNMELGAEYDSTTRNVAINIHATANEDCSGKLQVWVIENNVVGQQQMPGNVMNREYVHQHVFRTSVTNDIYGDDFSVTDAAPATISYMVTLDETWVPENLAIVAFVSNTSDGVLQVVKTALTTNEQ